MNHINSLRNTSTNKFDLASHTLLKHLLGQIKLANSATITASN